MSTPESTGTKSTRWKRYVAGGVLLAGLGTGAALAGNLAANAETTSGTAAVAGTADPTTSSITTAGSGATPDESKPQRSDETLLTGDNAAKVTAAALAKYPGATIQRVETDSDGVYEAHLTTADGTRVTVEVGADFTVTGTEAGGGSGGGGGGKGHGGGRGGSGETALTGDNAAKVTAAALAAYPGATIDRVETDSDGVYEAHLTTAAGEKVTAEIGSDFTVTGTETR